MTISLSLEGDSWEDAGPMSLVTFFDAQDGMPLRERDQIVTCLLTLGEYIGGGGAQPFWRLTRDLRLRP